MTKGLAVANPWDVLPRESQGDADANSLYTAVGMAATAWERVDGAQGTLFASIVQSFAGSTEAAYGSISSGPAREGMVKAAADRTFAVKAPDLLKDINSAVDEVGKFLARRNDIVHGVVTNILTPNRNFGHYLVPAPYNSRRHLTEAQSLAAVEKFKSLAEFYDTDHHVFGRQRYAYTASQVMTYVEHFRRLRFKIWEVAAKAEDKRNELLASSQRPRGPSSRHKAIRSLATRAS